MTNEPDTTPIRSLYAQRFAVDLETNRREQQAASARIAELDARLKQLRAEESWLCGMQGALPPASDGATAAAAAGAGDGQVPAQPVRTPAIVTAALSATATGTPAAESVPRPRRARKTTGATAVAKKSARPGKAARATTAPGAPGTAGTPAKAAARKPAAAKATTATKTGTSAGTTTGRAKPATTKAVTAKATPAATKGGTKSGTAVAAPTEADTAKTRSAKTGTAKTGAAPTATTEPPLRELVLALLVGAAEPRTVSEVTTALAEAHPGRPASTQVVRNTLETLAKKGAVDKANKQGSVMYTAPRPASGEPAAGPAATPATADDKATAGTTGPHG
ncbi:hypothetical protein [Streptomyces sp. NPDC058701]|uniref:hypothetical protein n=1 Tax=Streptomyces sp. NPDC058701 TaxID=3346608 RepID=UPI003655A77B